MRDQRRHAGLSRLAGNGVTVAGSLRRHRPNAPQQYRTALETQLTGEVSHCGTRGEAPGAIAWQRSLQVPVYFGKRRERRSFSLDYSSGSEMSPSGGSLPKPAPYWRP
jgi:hypothetical protein